MKASYLKLAALQERSIQQINFEDLHDFFFFILFKHFIYIDPYM